MSESALRWARAEIVRPKPKLGPAQARILLAIASMYDESVGSAAISGRTFFKLTGLTPGRVRDALVRLRDRHGLILIVRCWRDDGGESTNRYELPKYHPGQG